MNESRMMIVMGDKNWTRNALHQACALSRRNGAEVVLLKMVPVRHPLMLGDASGYIDLTFDDHRALKEMESTAEDYGVLLDVHLFQYATYWPAVVDAAEQMGATAVIARVPPSHIPYRQELQRRWLRRRLARRHQEYFALDELTSLPDTTPAPGDQEALTGATAQPQF